MNPDTLPAVVDCLIPPDDFPGGYDAGVCDYVEQLLNTDLAEHTEFFRAGIEAIDSEALEMYNAPFAVLTLDQQISILEDIESGAVKTSCGEFQSRGWERMNELEFYSDKGPTSGFKTIQETDPTHPYVSGWWPPGHIIGYEHTFTHTVLELLQALAEKDDRLLISKMT